ncbi:LysR family transcriptional regulator [Vitiosangium sp. GDMCC 1.1324]|uniref:LysR family transcriptional regulator n=1 Tax=Vitiosangium sp. (strain GDMCC 1.1324) TaxID=2138576 RepID=UPI000D34980A|nr:LysR family transcriptional regulator [Vitiosangium sp. GDMCC 1.1324]PTL76079.1 LysR family transcriptional regulator [Vitiosangium sp. GDMCC 1.1324]
MTFTQLEIFSLVVELRGFTAAALQLSISQSAVSHAIKSLEQELGVDLLERNKASVEVTEIGRQLLTRAREIIGLAEAMRQEVADARGLKRGSLRIGSFGPTSSLRLLPAILDAYTRAYPDIEVRVDESDDAEVVQWLQERRVDVGFVVLPDERFDTVELVEDQMMALVPRGNTLAKKSAVPLDSLCDAPFIMSGAGCGPLIEPLFASAQLAPRVRYRVAQVMTMLGMVERGDGVAVVAELALPSNVATTHPGLAAIPLRPAVKRRVGLATHDLRQATPAARALLEVAREVSRRNTFR